MAHLSKKIDYKYNEDAALKELQEYIDSTYDEHYSKNKFQATEFIIDGGHGEGFCIGNILKYAQRYGKKNGKDRRDLLKVIHYGIIALHVSNLENQEVVLGEMENQAEGVQPWEPSPRTESYKEYKSMFESPTWQQRFAKSENDKADT